MKFLDEYRDAELGRRLVERIHQRSIKAIEYQKSELGRQGFYLMHRQPGKSIRLMEFCGGHTVAIFKYGLRQLLPPTIEMVSGPGCPVCVTATADLDKAIALARLPRVIITTFGDLFKVPGSSSSLQQARAEGSDVRMVYSPRDALGIAKENPDKFIVFIGIGFETTAPGVAASILEAEQEGIRNYYVLSLHKLSPPVIWGMLHFGQVKLDGLICPGHVSAIIGSRPWEFIPRYEGIACVISGFEPLDVLLSIDMLLAQIEKGQPRVEIAYRRVVKEEGNQQALRLLYSVFEEGHALWRGFGVVPDSGLRLKEEYKRFDAERNFDIDPGPTREPKGCICDDILRGVKTPPDCGLFRRACTPENPVGPCMVSSEGSCAAHYHYGAGYG